MTELYELTFDGTTDSDQAEATVKSNVAKLFRANPDQVERLFSGKTVVLKNRLDKVSAMKYQQLLHKAGALCKIRLMKPAEETPAPAVKPQTDAAPARPSLKPEQTTIDNSAGLSVAPTGSDLLKSEEKKPAPPPAPDTTHISLKPQQGYLVEPDNSPAPAPPDTSHLSLEN